MYLKLDNHLRRIILNMKNLRQDSDAARRFAGPASVVTTEGHLADPDGVLVSRISLVL